MKFYRLFRARRKHRSSTQKGNDNNVPIETLLSLTSSETPQTIVDHQETITDDSTLSTKGGSYTATFASSSTSCTIPKVHHELMSTSRSGTPIDPELDGAFYVDNGEDTDRFIFATKTAYPEIFEALSSLQCIGICRNHKNVMKALHTHPGGDVTPVVVKVEDLYSPRAASSFCKHSRHEAAIFSTLNDLRYSDTVGHAHIVQLYDHHIFAMLNKHVFIFEYCQYGTLFSLIFDYGAYITLQERMQWAVDLSEGLAYMHDMEVAHRDIKLENIGLCWSVEKKRIVAKILDLGYSFFYSPTAIELSPSGSIDHIAPELIDARSRGHHPIYADLWAYAVSIYCLFECEKPFPLSANNYLVPLSSSCSYYKPRVLASFKSFDRFLRSYFTHDASSRPSIRQTLDHSEFFRDFPRENFTNIELFATLDDRRRAVSNLDNSE